MSDQGNNPNQPFDGQPKRNNRFYQPATWSPGGGPGGSPKVSGGYEQSKTNGPISTRGINRRDQRYTESAASLIAKRNARATSEYAGTVVLQGQLGTIDLRSPSGNNYDLAGDTSTCDCPDFWRLAQSGYTTVQCKHQIIAAARVSVVGGYANLPWSTARLAEAIGVDRRTAENLCKEGEVPATKSHGIWVINYDGTVQTAIDNYQARLVMPNEEPPIPV